MKILVLTSGGDAQGMNRFLYQIYKKFGKKVYACKYGFRGLIDGNFEPLKNFEPFKNRNQAGSCIKSARCPEFATVKGFKKGLANAKEFDWVIVLGGNGSYRGACQLSDNGVKTIFVPATIDNDVDNSEYSLGFHSAVKACCQYIKNTMPSMEAFNRCCFFEVMGRHHGAIAQSTALALESDFVICNEDDVDFGKMAKVVKENAKREHSSMIVVRENILPLSEFVSKLKNACPKVDIVGLRIGHFQRGFKPTKVERAMADAFAKQAIKVIRKKGLPSAVVSVNGKILAQ